MKKYILLLSSSLSISILLTGCVHSDSPNSIVENTDPYVDESLLCDLSDTFTELANAPKDTEPNTICSLPLQSADRIIEQGGPYGKLSLSLPDGWCYETCPTDSEKLLNGLYGIHFYPEGVADSFIELVYIDSFGVCGTGLFEDTATIAGNPACIGTYDHHDYWDFISFQDDYSGIVALTYNVESWWTSYEKQVMNILNTLTYDASIKEGGVYIYGPESEANKIGLHITLKKVSSTGAILSFHQYDEKAPTGVLEYGETYVIEVLKNDQWEELPVTLEGAYGFHDLAYNIPNSSTTEQELNWAWLYGTLEPGTYRIRKEILDFRGRANFDKYLVYAQFVLN